MQSYKVTATRADRNDSFRHAKLSNAKDWYRVATEMGYNATIELWEGVDPINPETTGHRTATLVC